MKEYIKKLITTVLTLMLLALINQAIWNNVIELGFPKITFSDSLGILVISNVLFKTRKVELTETQ